MSTEGHLTEAKKPYQKAAEEFERAKERSDSTVLRDACGKAWLSAVEVTNALLVKKRVREEELPKTDRGRRFMAFKYAGKELRRLYSSLRNDLHIEGYYDGNLSFEEMEECFDDLLSYIQKIEELKEGKSR